MPAIGAPMKSRLQVVYVISAFFAGLAGALSAGFVSGLSGFAFAMVSLGFWAHVLAPTVAAPLIVACAGRHSSRPFQPLGRFS